MLSDQQAAGMQRELDELRARMRRLEQRLDTLEPETVSGIGGLRATPRNVTMAGDSEPPAGGSESAVIDAVADAFEALGFFRKED